MKLALESFIHYKHPQKIVILGDMLELGIESILEHQKILRICLDNKLNYMTVGPIFKSINNKNSYENVIQIKGEMSGVTEFAVLLKGSRGIKLEELIESL